MTAAPDPQPGSFPSLPPASRRTSSHLVPALLFALCIAFLAAPASAQQVRVDVEPLQCIPLEQHAPVTARVTGEPGGSTVRLYFRRLHQEVEDFYYVVMNASGDGDYWAVLPKPADEVLETWRLEETETEEQEENPWAAWWQTKERVGDRDPNDDLNTEIIEERAAVGQREPRDWMMALSLEELQEWLEELENEAVEYYAQAFDASGSPIPNARSITRATVVTEDCEVDLDVRERGQAMNLVVGETAPWQIGRPVFHWLCDGIVSRIDYRGILRVDEICRACAFAMTRNLLMPVTAGSVGVLGLVIDDDEEPVSPIDPDDDDDDGDDDGDG